MTNAIYCKLIKVTRVWLNQSLKVDVICYERCNEHKKCIKEVTYIFLLPLRLCIYMCVCVCIYIYTHTHTHTYTHIHTTHTSTPHIHTPTRTHACVPACVYKNLPLSRHVVSFFKLLYHILLHPYECIYFEQYVYHSLPDWHQYYWFMSYISFIITHTNVKLTVPCFILSWTAYRTDLEINGKVSLKIKKFARNNTCI